MRVRFQADADLNQIIVAAILRRAPEIDFRSAVSSGFGGLNDLEVLVPQHMSVSAVVDDLVLIWSATEAEEWVNRICYLPL